MSRKKSFLIRFWSGLCLILLGPINSDLHADPLLGKLAAEAPSLSQPVLTLALKAANCAVHRGLAHNVDHLAIIDFSLPSTEDRFWAFDLKNQRLLWRELVSHGKNSGDNYATQFSNRLGSLQSSLGLFKAGSSYIGQHGYSMRLLGLEPGVNDKALERAIVIHGATYVNEDYVLSYGRLGRSWGCPALRTEVIDKVIDTFKNEGLLFAYYPDQKWIQQSKFLNGC